MEPLPRPGRPATPDDRPATPDDRRTGEGRRERAAVVGAGVAGLTAAYALQRRFDVTLYESEGRLGGHAHTHDVVTPDAGSIPIDSGFIVFNERTYPQLCRLFAELDVPSRETEMSMSIHCGGCGLEYAGARGIGGVVAQPRSLARPRFVRMLGSIRRFHGLARQATAAGDVGMTLRSFLIAHRFSPYFVRHYVVPVVSSVWSAGSADALAYPAHHLFTFLDNHGMLSVTGSPAWRTVVGGSRAYVERIAKGLSAIETSTPVRAIVRQAAGIEIRDDADRGVLFDRVVVATHADTALSLVDRPTREERNTLGAFRYSRNETWLHTDDRVLPRSPRARASWNYLLPGCGADPRQVLVSYDMNRLQALPSGRPHVVTLNATDRVDPAKVVARMTYEHPIFTSESVAAQDGLSGLNSGTLAYAGAYHGWGFHEDGCRAGLVAAASLGAR